MATGHSEGDSEDVMGAHITTEGLDRVLEPAL